ncbi:uncharacterized protein TM35_000451810 [Trypanosoma theileri]|uniref:Mucin-associated surface protein (MASP) n=1 Tax=Trypanosoma theileri TaxID=67003 RepID=A0A1X0NIZ9_9TRYP|nr:uncharacterized protein TM35_000451810 [Trypanosoma theileri]ORC84443.1 hypothetical protein TM35_000451810 [Trypanosoma theileri]
MMMMMRRVMCVLAVVLCCTCGYTMAAAATTTAGQPKAVMATYVGVGSWDDFLAIGRCDSWNGGQSENTANGVDCGKWKKDGNLDKVNYNISNSTKAKNPEKEHVPELPQRAEELREEHDETSAEEDPLHQTTSQTTSTGTVSGHKVPVSKPAVTHPSDSESGEAQPGRNAERAPLASSTSAEPPSSPTAPEDSSTTSAASTNESTDNSLPGDNNTTQQPSSEGTTAPNSISAADSQETTINNESTDNSASGTDIGAAAISDSQETNTSTMPSPESNVSEAPTATPSLVPNSEISSTASTVQNKANVDSSSVSPVWMRTAAPLLIVAVLFSITVY